MVFTKESAKEEHKRGGKMMLSNKQLSFAYLGLCESMTGKGKKTVAMEFYRNGLITYRVEDVEIYLRGRVEELVPKIEEPEYKTIEVVEIEVVEENTNKRSIEELKKLQMDIMNSNVVATRPSMVNTVNGVYTAPTDKYGFYEE